MNAFVFLGQRGWRAFSLDETGASLPAEHGPWNSFRAVQVDSDTPAWDALQDGRDYVYQSEDSLRA